MSSEARAGTAVLQIRYALSHLRSRNGHHEFEHLCREVVRLRITPNVLPATGPVAAGGDQGRDFETFHSYIRERIPDSFLAIEENIPIVFACTLRRENLAGKVKADLRTIKDSGPVSRVYFFCEQDIPVARRHDLCKWARDNHGVEIEIIDGQALSELLATEKCLWIAERYLGVQVEGSRSRGNDGVRLEASASGQATVNQAGRDLHVHLDHGIRRVVAGNALDAECPYPGLAPFTVEQGGWFFGRDKLTASLLIRLNGCLTSGGPVMVVAASGAGKSSLLRAGLLHKVAKGRLTVPGSRRWPQIVFTPGADPLHAAAIALRAALPGIPASPAAPCSGVDNFDGLLAQVLEAVGAPRAVIVVDQFEELFTLCESEQKRRDFISWIWRIAAADTPGGPSALVACGLRADFYNECTKYPQVLHSLQADQILVGSLSGDELRQAIRGPAEMASLDIEPGLVEVMLADVRRGYGDGGGIARDDLAMDYDAGRLPLLAHALQATWQLRHGSMLTVDGYRATGGLEHAVAETAEQVFGRLNEVGQVQARKMFLRLVKIGASSGEDARRPMSRSDLTSGRDAALVVLHAYITSRLVTAGRDGIQISHEALLGAWPRLRSWLDEDRAGNLIRQDLEEAATGWDAAGDDPSRLYRGARLQGAAAWAGDHGQDLSETAQRFLLASSRLARRINISRQSAVAALAALALVASITSIVAFRQRDSAIRQRDLAIYDRLIAGAAQAAPANSSLAAQLLLAAYRLRPSRDLATRLISTETEPLSATLNIGSPVDSVTFSPHGRILAVSDQRGAVRLWQVIDPAHPRKLGPPLAYDPEDPGCPVAFSPDGRTAAVGSQGGTNRLWDITDPAYPRKLGPPLTDYPESPACPVAFSPDGHILSLNTGGAAISLWRVSDPAHPRQLGSSLWEAPPLAIRNFADSNLPEVLVVSPNDRILAAGNGYGAIRLWDITDPARPRRLSPPFANNDPLGFAIFSNNSRILAVGNGNNAIRLWDITDPARPRRLSPPFYTGSAVGLAVAFGRDNRTFAVGNSNGTIQLWDIADPAHPSKLGPLLETGSLTSVNSLAFSPDGHTLAAGYNDGTVRLWSIPRPLLDTNSGSLAWSIAVSPDGRTLAVGSFEGTVSLWDISYPGHPRELGPPLASSDRGDVESLAFGRDGRVLAAGNSDGTIRLWSVANPAHPRQLGKPLGSSDKNSAHSVTFSPNGRILAACYDDGSIRLWSVTDTGSPRSLGPPAAPYSQAGVANSIAFSPDGRILAISYADGIQLWNVADPGNPWQLQPTLAATTTANSVAFSVDGRTFASGDSDGTFQLWDFTHPAHPRKLGPPLAVGSGDTNVSVAFSPDNRTLASADSDGTIRLWDVTDPAHPRELGQPITISTSNWVAPIEFSANGRILVSSGFADTITLLSMSVDYAVHWICGTTDLTPRQWQEFAPYPYKPPCPQ